MAKDERPIIIKRIVEDDHDGHHGGAWKVAYADFVTAMMAFFLMLWILSITEEEVLVGIADYFSPTISAQSGPGGEGPLDGMTVGEPGVLTSSNSPINTIAVPDIAKADPIDDMRDPGEVIEYRSSDLAVRIIDGETQVEVNEENATSDIPANQNNEAEQMQEELQSAMRAKDEQSFADLEEKIVQAMNAVPDLKPLIPNVIYDKTEEGLRIQIVDQEGRSMFRSGSALVEGQTKTLMSLIGEAISQLPNDVIISGHTDAIPFANEGGEIGYGNWELSADRANATRRIFLIAGIKDSQIGRVSGLADTDPMDVEDPDDPTNRRISIVLKYAKAPDIELINEAIRKN